MGGMMKRMVIINHRVHHQTSPQGCVVSHHRVQNFSSVITETADAVHILKLRDFCTATKFLSITLYWSWFTSDGQYFLSHLSHRTSYNICFVCCLLSLLLPLSLWLSVSVLLIFTKMSPVHAQCCRTTLFSDQRLKTSHFYLILGRQKRWWQQSILFKQNNWEST